MKPRNSQPLTASRVLEMYRDHVEGMTITDLKEKYAYTPARIKTAFEQSGLQLIKHPRRRWTVLPDELVKAMYADHVNGMRLRDLQRKYQRQDSNIVKIFRSRNLPIIDRGNSGCFQKTYIRKTEDELVALAATQTYIKIPDAIRWEWREWPMEKRRWFIQLVRKRLKSPNDRPQSPFSANVIPFEYGSPEADALLRAKNGGKRSHVRGCKIKLTSQGVIWNNELWFWVRKTGYVMGVPWTPRKGRPMLHQVIWEQTHGMKKPDKCVIRHRDGNPNNMHPDNLYLATQNDVARENQAKALAERSRKKTSALLNLHLKRKEKTEHEHGPERILGFPERRRRKSRKAA